GPKPAMIRPRTGQRNDGSAPAGSAVFTALSSPLGATGAASRALWGDSAVARFGPAAAAAGASARGATGAGGVGAADTRTSGMTMRSPIFTMVSGGMLLALASARTGLP